jgi:hypothetical protein
MGTAVVTIFAVGITDVEAIKTRLGYDNKKTVEEFNMYFNGYGIAGEGGVADRAMVFCNALKKNMENQKKQCKNQPVLVNAIKKIIETTKNAVLAFESIKRQRKKEDIIPESKKALEIAELVHVFQTYGLDLQHLAAFAEFANIGIPQATYEYEHDTVHAVVALLEALKRLGIEVQTFIVAQQQAMLPQQTTFTAPVIIPTPIIPTPAPAPVVEPARSVSPVQGRQ